MSTEVLTKIEVQECMCVCVQSFEVRVSTVGPVSLCVCWCHSKEV